MAELSSPTHDVPACPIAFALDFPSVDDARRAAAQVAPAIGMLKVGLELFVEAGPRAAVLGAELGLPVFLDLKLHDIPETVDRAVARAAALGARFLTVHASGGAAMLARAQRRAEAEKTGLELLAVTVLTSLDDADLARAGVQRSVREQSLALAQLARGVGISGFVCSPQEVLGLRAALGPSVTLVTPGVRPASQARGDDQKRVATAGDAIRAGATWLVVGRPIRDASDPLEAARALGREIALARATRSSS